MERKRQILKILSCFCLMFIFMAGRGEAYHSRSLKKAFSALIRLAPETGALVFDIQSESIIYSLKKRSTFVPASVAKLITSYVALKTLGPEFTFRTEVYARHLPQSGYVTGNLYIKGYGDPFLVEEKTWILAEKLCSRGLKRVKGDLVIDGSYFSPPVAKIDIDENRNRPYNSVLSALSVDFNTVAFEIFPPAEFGTKCHISPIPMSPYVNVINRVRVSGECSYPKIDVVRSARKDGVGEIFTLSGVIPHRARPFEIRSNVAFPLLFAGYALKTKLRALGTRIDGKVKLGKVPEESELLTTYHSPPLKDILYGLNRFSNNFMAEMIFRAIGAKVYGAPATVSKSKKVVETELRKLGLTSHDYFLVNGSGLSREMRVSPYAIMKILVNAYKDFSINAEFLSSLATPRTSGTLKCRFSCSPHSPPVLRAKTGSMNGVVSLAGYVSSREGKIFGVVILCNNVKNSAKVKNMIDKIICLLRE